jgi:hypothetical protein
MQKADQRRIPWPIKHVDNQENTAPKSSHSFNGLAAKHPIGQFRAITGEALYAGKLPLRFGLTLSRLFSDCERGR